MLDDYSGYGDYGSSLAPPAASVDQAPPGFDDQFDDTMARALIRGAAPAPASWAASAARIGRAGTDYHAAGGDYEDAHLRASLNVARVAHPAMLPRSGRLRTQVEYEVGQSSADLDDAHFALGNRGSAPPPSRGWTFSGDTRAWQKTSEYANSLGVPPARFAARYGPSPREHGATRYADRQGTIYSVGESFARE